MENNKSKLYKSVIPKIVEAYQYDGNTDPDNGYGIPKHMLDAMKEFSLCLTCTDTNERKLMFYYPGTDREYTLMKGDYITFDTSGLVRLYPKRMFEVLYNICCEGETSHPKE